MKKWKDLKKGDVIFRLETFRNREDVGDFSIHPLVGVEMFAKHFFAFNYKDNVKHHYVEEHEEWDENIDHFSSFAVHDINSSKAVKDDFGIIEYYSDAEALKQRIFNMKSIHENEIKKIEAIENILNVKLKK